MHISREPPSSEREVAQAIDAADALATCYAEVVDRLSPGHAHGVGKVRHQRELVTEVKQQLHLFTLSPREQGLLVILAAVHDIGRFVEAVRQVQQGISLLHAGEQHGFLSRRVLEGDDLILESCALAGCDGVGLLAAAKRLRSSLQFLSSHELEDLLQATAFHAERDVTLDPQSPTWRLCYALRDLDKREIFLDQETYLQPSGIVREFLLHGAVQHRYEAPSAGGLTKEEVLAVRADSDAVTRLEKYVSVVLSGEKIEPLGERSGLLGKAVRRLDRFLFGPIPQRWLDAIARHESCDKRIIGSSGDFFTQPGYYVFSFGLLFDIRHPQVLIEVLSSSLVDARVKTLRTLLRHRGQESLSDEIVGHLNRWLSCRQESLLS